MSIIQRAAAKDLSGFYAQWFERTGAPGWQLRWEQSTPGVHGESTQTVPFYRASLELEIQGTNGERLTRTLDVNGERTQFHWPLAFRVRTVILDPHFYVLHWLPDLHAEALARGRPYEQTCSAVPASLKKPKQSFEKPWEP